MLLQQVIVTTIVRFLDFFDFNSVFRLFLERSMKSINGAESSHFSTLLMDETNTTVPIANASDVDNPLISAENELWTKIFVAFLIVLITIANVLMGCEVCVFKGY